jgi:hypothetical protein
MSLAYATAREQSQPESQQPALRLGKTLSAAPSLMRLAINQPGDAYEQEADRTADAVMRMPSPESGQLTGNISSGQGRIQRKCSACEAEERKCAKYDEEEHALQRKESGAGAAFAPPAVHEVLRSPGESLDAGTRAFMEPRFGHDFAKVRVHTDAKAAASARAVDALAYTVGNDIVFDSGRFNMSADGRHLLAHELTHVVQQTGGLARKPAEEDQKPKKAKAPKCDTGCGQRWGQDTTCSKWGFTESVREMGEGKKWRSFGCCNTWPLSVETFARNQLGINGAASCTARHEREIATVSMGEKEVQVLCSDTIPNDMFGGTDNAKDCAGSISAEVIEMSPKAMLDLAGSLDHALHVTVCYSGSKEDMCLHNGPGAKSFPTVGQCLTRGCQPVEDTPSHKDSGWPRV